MLKWLIVFLILTSLGVCIFLGWSALAREHQEAANIKIQVIDFKQLKNGVFTGVYEGGVYKWRKNKVQIEIRSGKLDAIKLLSSAEGLNTTNFTILFDRVVKAQSLQVDDVSGATLSSKACLKGVENALIQAQTMIETQEADL